MLEYPFMLSEEECRVCLMTLEEFKTLDGEYPHKRSLYRSMNPTLYCKCEFYEECIQGTMRIPGNCMENDGIQTFGFYLKEHELLLIEDGNCVKALFEKIQSSIQHAKNPRHLLLYFFEALTEEDVLYLGQQEEKLADMEASLLERLPEHFHEEIILYRKQFQMYHMYYEQLIHIGEQMQAEAGEFIKEEYRAWQLYEKRMQRLHNYVEILRDYLIQIRDLYQSLLDVQQNKVMSILTVVTTIFLPLTLIAGWYGMNFPGMPEFHWKYAYPVVIVVSIVITVLEILFFRKKKML